MVCQPPKKSLKIWVRSYIQSDKWKLQKKIKHYTSLYTKYQLPDKLLSANPPPDTQKKDEPPINTAKLSLNKYWKYNISESFTY